jgi:integrase
MIGAAMGRRNPEGWRYFVKTDRTVKPHVIRVFRHGAPRGEPKYRDFYFESKTDAMAATKHLRDMFGDWSPTMSLGDWLASWLERRRVTRALAPGTVATYAGHIEHDIKGFAIADVAIEDLNEQHVARWQEELIRRHKLSPTGQPMSETISPSTARSALRMLRTALRGAKVEGLLKRENPAVVAEAPPVRKYRKPNLMDSEIRRLFSALMADEERALWWTHIVLGRRRGEILAIRLDDVNALDRVIEMEYSMSKGNRNFVLGAGKSHEPRAPVPTYLLELFDGQIERRAALRLAVGERWTETPFLFTTRLGTPMDPNKVSRRFQEIRRSAKVPYLRLHDLRGYCASTLLDLTTDLRLVQAVIGWSTLEMAGEYSNVPMTRRAALGEQLEQRMRSYLTDGGVSSVRNGVSEPSLARDTAPVAPQSNGDGTTDHAGFDQTTSDFGVRGSVVPQSVPDLLGWYLVQPQFPEVSSGTAGCPMMGCQGECQAALPPPYQRTRILLVIQTHPILGPALRAVEGAEADPLVRKQVRVGVARYLWWCAAHRLDPTFADERQLAFAFEAGPDSVSYRRQLRSYARRFVEEVIEHARPREARDGSAIGVRHRPTRSSAKAPAPPTKVVTVGRAGPPARQASRCRAGGSRRSASQPDPETAAPSAPVRRRGTPAR